MNSQLLATQWTTFGFAVENGCRVESFLLGGRGILLLLMFMLILQNKNKELNTKNRLQTLKKRKRKRNLNGSQYILVLMMKINLATLRKNKL